MNTFVVQKRAIQVAEYQKLRGSTGWNMLADEVVEKALKNDLFAVCILDKDQIVGIGRVIGDGAIYFYIQDIIVLPAYRGKGIGKMIMQQIEAFLETNANQHSFIGLMAADGVAEFYYQFGYRERKDGSPGMFKIMK